MKKFSYELETEAPTEYDNFWGECDRHSQKLSTRLSDWVEGKINPKLRKAMVGLSALSIAASGIIYTVNDIDQSLEKLQVSSEDDDPIYQQPVRTGCVERAEIKYNNDPDFVERNLLGSIIECQQKVGIHPINDGN